MVIDTFTLLHYLVSSYELDNDNRKQQRNLIMQILVQTREVYGNKLIYPICHKAKLFAKIANAKTLAVHNIQKIKELGYEVIEERDLFW